MWRTMTIGGKSRWLCETDNRQVWMVTDSCMSGRGSCFVDWSGFHGSICPSLCLWPALKHSVQTPTTLHLAIGSPCRNACSAGSPASSYVPRCRPLRCSAISSGSCRRVRWTVWRIAGRHASGPHQSSSRYAWGHTATAATAAAWRWCLLLCLPIVISHMFWHWWSDLLLILYIPTGGRKRSK